jgi:hypothetical protein
MVLHQDSVSQFSLQPSTASEPRFDFPAQCNSFSPAFTGKGRKSFAAPIDDSDFESPLNRLSRPPQA